MGTFIDLLRNDPDTSTDSVEPGEPGDGDLMRYCFRYRGQCAMGIVWRERGCGNDNEYVLLAAWMDENGVEHRASWDIYGDWEIGGLFQARERLEAGLKSPNRPHGLRIEDECDVFTLFVSSLQSPMCGLRFETEQPHYCMLDGEPHPCRERVLMPRDAIHALLELIQTDPLRSEDTSLSVAFMRCDAERGPWIHDKARWHNRAQSPLIDALVEWLGSLRTWNALEGSSDTAWLSWSPFKRPHARGSSGEPALSRRPFSAPR